MMKKIVEKELPENVSSMSYLTIDINYRKENRILTETLLFNQSDSLQYWVFFYYLSNSITLNPFLMRKYSSLED